MKPPSRGPTYRFALCPTPRSPPPPDPRTPESTQARHRPPGCLGHQLQHLHFRKRGFISFGPQSVFHIISWSQGSWAGAGPREDLWVGVPVQYLVGYGDKYGGFWLWLNHSELHYPAWASVSPLGPWQGTGPVV